MARKRFTRDEKATFAAGTEVEWLHGACWHPGVIISGKIVEFDGWEDLGVRNTASTATVTAGQKVAAGPGHIRLPQSAE